MPEPTPQVLASWQLLQEVCTLLAPFRDDAVLIGGWVPEIRFPDAFPGHVGSIDVDFATVIDDPPVRAVLTKLAGKFRDEEDSGPGDVVEVEEPMGEARAIRKFAVFTNVDDFLRAVGIVV